MPLMSTFIIISTHLLMAFGLDAVAQKLGLTLSHETVTLYLLGLAFWYCYTLCKITDNLKVAQRVIEEELKKNRTIKGEIK